jgi:hypothetical protein
VSRYNFDKSRADGKLSVPEWEAAKPLPLIQQSADWEYNFGSRNRVTGNCRVFSAHRGRRRGEMIRYLIRSRSMSIYFTERHFFNVENIIA